MSPLKNVVASFVPVADNSFIPTVPVLGVPIDNAVPITITKSTVSVESGASEKTIFVPSIVNAFPEPGACITPDTEHKTLFSEPGATAVPSKTFVKANVVAAPLGVIVLHLI